MIRIALSSLAVLALAACASARPSSQYAQADAGVVIDRAPLPFDPEPLPPNTFPGDCVTRMADGPSYRWARTACASQGNYASYAPYPVERYVGGGDHSYGETVTEHYVGPGYANQGPIYEGYSEYAYGQGGYGPGGGSSWPRYRYAGRDSQGYLVWPGKAPRW